MTSVARGSTTCGWNAVVSGWLVATFAASIAVADDNCDQWNTRGYFLGSSVEEVQACLQASADPNARGGGGYRPLHLAALTNTDAGIIDALVAAGAELDTRTDFGGTALHVAAGFKQKR